MVEKKWVETMKIIGTTKEQRTVKLKQIDIQLKICDIDNLINFLSECKKEFIERQQDCSVKKMTLKNKKIFLENILNYDIIKNSGYELLDCHVHYKDWSKINLDEEEEIVIHTHFKAKKKEDGTFIWINEE